MDTLEMKLNDLIMSEINRTNVTTKLRDLDPHRLHYVKLPDAHHIVIDFGDIWREFCSIC